MLGEIFLAHAPIFALYEPYVANLRAEAVRVGGWLARVLRAEADSAESRAGETGSEKPSRDEIQSLLERPGRGMLAYLLKPYSRLCRYPVLLKVRCVL